MGGFIRMDKDLEDDPRVSELSDDLAATTGVDPALARNVVLGALYRLWRYGDTHLGRHNRLKNALHGPARISEVTALPLSLVLKFPTEWLIFHSDGSVELPDYTAKNNLINRDIRRAQGRDRVRRFRERKRREDANGNASSGVTGKPLQRYKSVTTGTGTGPETGTGTSETGTGPKRAARTAAPSAAAPRKDPTFADTYRQRFGCDPP